MSLTTWKREYYPEPAAKAATRGDLAAVEHSLRKWQGAARRALATHKLTNGLACIFGPVRGTTFNFTADNCALCVRHLDVFANEDQARCGTCPLYAVLGKACDSHDQSPFRIWVRTDDPAPMLAALRKARTRVRRQMLATKQAP